MEGVRYVVLVWLFGCYAPQPAPGAPCSADGSCPSGLVCAMDRCLPPGASSDASNDTPDAPDDSAAVDALSDGVPDADLLSPRLVQQATKSTPQGTEVTASFAMAPSAGNILVAVAGCPSGSLATIEGGTLSWQRAAFSTIHPNVEVHVGVANGDGEVQIGLPTCTTQMSLSISEWANLEVPPIDQVDANAGLASPATAGSIATSGTRLLLFSVASFTPNTFGIPSEGPWSELLPIDGVVETRTWYRVVTTPGSYAPTVTETRHQWDATLVSLKGE